VREPERRRRRVFGAGGPEPARVRLLDVARALLADDAGEEAERLAAELARDRERREIEAAEIEAHALQERRRADSAREIQAACKREGVWWPPSHRFRWR